MSDQTVLDGLCSYFGGTYDPATRAYRSPRVMGVGAVRRAFPKRDDQADYFLAMGTGTRTGCLLIAQLPSGSEQRSALPAVAGWKEVRHSVELHCFFRSVASYAEDSQDDMYAVKDALIAHIHADVTCGTGGFESGGFQIGEGGSPWIAWDLAQAASKTEETKGYLVLRCQAKEFVQA